MQLYITSYTPTDTAKRSTGDGADYLLLQVQGCGDAKRIRLPHGMGRFHRVRRPLAEVQCGYRS